MEYCIGIDLGGTNIAGGRRHAGRPSGAHTERQNRHAVHAG